MEEEEVVGGGRRRRSASSWEIACCCCLTNLRTRQVSVDRDTEITLIRTKARSLLESSTKDLTRPTLVNKIQRTCPLVDSAASVWC